MTRAEIKKARTFAERETIGYNNEAYRLINTLYDELEKTEAEKPKKGEWINAGHDEWSHYIQCSACQRLLRNASKWNFCPNCGAKMERGDNT